MPPRLPIHRRHYTTSRHAQWYADILPPIIPIFLLGSAVYLGLQLTQLKLAHEKYMDESARRIAELEAQVVSLREKRLTQAPLNSAVSASGQPTPSPSKRIWRWWWW